MNYFTSDTHFGRHRTLTLSKRPKIKEVDTVYHLGDFGCVLLRKKRKMIESVMMHGKPNDKKKSCFDCCHCMTAVSNWCINEVAVEKRGASIPGVCNCPYWRPTRTIDQLSFFEKFFGNYLKI